MKLCIITPSLSGGGAEKVAINLANYYSTNGLDVHLLSLKDSTPYKNLIHPNVNFSTFGVSRARQSFFNLRRFIKNMGFTHVLSIKRDVNIILGICFLFDKNITCIFREAALLNKKSKIKSLLLKIAYKRSNLIIANSNDTKKSLIVNKGTKDSSKIEVIGNPVVTDDLFSKSKLHISHHWLSDPSIYVITNIARLDPLKNQSLLIKSFSDVVQERPQARLLIIGDGQEENNLKKLASNLRISQKIDFLSFRPNPYPWFFNSNLFVLTSKSEGFGNVLVEALACGTPVVSVACPGGPRMILGNGKYGTLVPSEHQQKLSRAIIENIDGNIAFEKKDLVHRGYEYSLEKIANLYLSAISRH